MRDHDDAAPNPADATTTSTTTITGSRSPAGDRDHESMRLPPPAKLTASMAASLSHLCATLTCTLCDRPYRDANTLTCGHTFCLGCISEYSANSWDCPYPGCCMPITVGGPGGAGLGKRDYGGSGGDSEGRRAGGGGVNGKGGGFARTNPILNGCVSSLGRVLKVLNEAEDGWWKDSEKSARKKKKEEEREQKNGTKGRRAGENGMNKRNEGCGDRAGGRSRKEYGDGRKSAVTFDINVEGSSDEEEMIDFNPTSNQNDDDVEDKLQSDEDAVVDSNPSSPAHAYTPSHADGNGNGNGTDAAADASHQVGFPASQASVKAGASQKMDTTALPGDRDSLFAGLGLSARSDGVPPSESAADLMDVTILPRQRDSLMGGIGLSSTDNNTDDINDEEYCTAASKQGYTDEEDGQMTDGTNNTNPNHYLTGREEDEYGDNDAQGIDDDDGAGAEDSEATMQYSIPSPSTDRKSNVSRRCSATMNVLARSDTLNTVDTVATHGSPCQGGVGDLSTLEEGSCETSTANATNATRDCAVGENDEEMHNKFQGEEPSQCHSLLGQVSKMERQLDSALADAIRSPSAPPRLNSSGRSGLDHSCTIPREADVEVDDEEGPVFGSQGLSPILIGGSQQALRESIGCVDTSTTSMAFRLETHAPASTRAEPHCRSSASKLTRMEPSPNKATHDGPIALKEAERSDREAKTMPEGDSNKRKAASSMHELRKSTISSSTNHKPHVFFLTSSVSLSASSVRTIRKCLKSNKFGLLGSSDDANHNHTVAEDNSDLDLPFDFESPESRSDFLAALQSSRSGQFGAIYAISADSEYPFIDGYIVPRSFRYLLAVAAKLHMVDISYIANNCNDIGRSTGAAGRYLIPQNAAAHPEDMDDACGRRKRSKRGGPTGSNGPDPSKINPDTNAPYAICGDVDTEGTGAPQRAISASGEAILEGYTVFLFGDFDHVASPSARAGGRSRARSSGSSKVDDSNLYSRGRLSLLLHLCGADVVDLKEVVQAMEHKATNSASASSDIDHVLNVLQSRGRTINTVVLTRYRANARDYRLARKFLADHREALKSGGVESAPIIVGAEWVLDTIGNFSVQDLEKYQA